MSEWKFVPCGLYWAYTPGTGFAQRILCQTYDSVGLTPALLRAYELQSIYKKVIS